MQNDTGAYYLLLLSEDGVTFTEHRYDNAEAARGHARMNEHSNPNGTRHLFKMLPYSDPIEVMP
jgi:hypothetical protein